MIPKKIYVLVGGKGWGKSYTIFRLFEKRRFFALKNTIAHTRFGDRPFLVLNTSNNRVPSKDFIERLDKVLENHQWTDASILLNITLQFGNNKSSVSDILAYLNQLWFCEVHYIVLRHGWFSGDSLNEVVIAELERMTTDGHLHFFDDEINESEAAFDRRLESIAQFINDNAIPKINIAKKEEAG